MPYPTRQEILKSPPKFPPEVINYINYWKNSIWPQGVTTKQQKGWISLLLLEISLLYKKPFKKIKCGPSYKYSPATKTICLGPKPSIISSLHELGHHLYGASELEACKFSVHLFKEAFPKSFEKLTWKGHTLVKKPNT
jgi:hypothetical protein